MERTMSSGSFADWEGRISIVNAANREPKRCKNCGVALEYYGLGLGRVSAHWHLTPEAETSAVSYLCGKCYRESLGAMPRGSK